MQRNDERVAWELTPFEAVGPLRFGMSKAEVAATLVEEPWVIDHTREAFDKAGAQPGYDGDGLVDMVLVHDPAYLVVRGVEVRTDQPLPEAVAALEAAGLHGHYRAGSTWFEEDGVVLYAPNGLVEGAGAYRKGYDTGAG